MPYSVLDKLESADGPLTVKAMAKILGVSDKTIYREAGEPAPAGIPCFHVGAAVRFDPAAVAYWYRKRSPVASVARREAVQA